MNNKKENVQHNQNPIKVSVDKVNAGAAEKNLAALINVYVTGTSGNLPIMMNQFPVQFPLRVHLSG